jgi:hypothetical protein
MVQAHAVEIAVKWKSAPGRPRLSRERTEGRQRLANPMALVQADTVSTVAVHTVE